jgi:hypothetical protein
MIKSLYLKNNSKRLREPMERKLILRKILRG